MQKMSELLRFNGVQSAHISTNVIEKGLTQFTFGSPSASFYIKEYK